MKAEDWCLLKFKVLAIYLPRLSLVVGVLRGNRDESSIQVNNANIFCYVGRSIHGEELVFFFIFTISIQFVYRFLSLNDFLRGKTTSDHH